MWFIMQEWINRTVRQHSKGVNEEKEDLESRKEGQVLSTVPAGELRGRVSSNWSLEEWRGDFRKEGFRKTRFDEFSDIFEHLEKKTLGGMCLWIDCTRKNKNKYIDNGW